MWLGAPRDFGIPCKLSEMPLVQHKLHGGALRQQRQRMCICIRARSMGPLPTRSLGGSAPFRSARRCPEQGMA